MARRRCSNGRTLLGKCRKRKSSRRKSPRRKSSRRKSSRRVVYYYRSPPRGRRSITGSNCKYGRALSGHCKALGRRPRINGETVQGPKMEGGYFSD